MTPILVALCYTGVVTATITQRELRNNSADVMRRLQAGESFTLTSNGRIIGSLTPAAQPTPLPITRRATRTGFDGFPLHATLGTSASAVLDELRQDRF